MTTARLGNGATVAEITRYAWPWVYMRGQSATGRAVAGWVHATEVTIHP